MSMKAVLLVFLALGSYNVVESQLMTGNTVFCFCCNNMYCNILLLLTIGASTISYRCFFTHLGSADVPYIRPTSRRSALERLKEEIDNLKESIKELTTAVYKHNAEHKADHSGLKTMISVYCQPEEREPTESNPASSCKSITERNPDLPSAYYWIRNSDGTGTRVYCNMNEEAGCGDGTRGWARIAHLDMSDPTHQCPAAWKEITSPKRTCGRKNQTLRDRGGCSSVSFSTHGIPYSRIRGKIRGYQVATPDAFGLYIPVPQSSYNIEYPYMDGVVLTRGSPKKHIWSFIASWGETLTNNQGCPCNPQTDTSGFTIPSWVGNDYFCEAAYDGSTCCPFGSFFTDDPLWDGQSCQSDSTCCQFNGPPWFCKELSETTTDDIEVAICADQSLGDEDTPLDLIEIYVQ